MLEHRCRRYSWSSCTLKLQMLLIPNTLCCSLYKRNCVCTVTKFLPAKNFCQLLWVKCASAVALSLWSTEGIWNWQHLLLQQACRTTFHTDCSHVMFTSKLSKERKSKFKCKILGHGTLVLNTVHLIWKFTSSSFQWYHSLQCYWYGWLVTGGFINSCFSGSVPLSIIAITDHGLIFRTEPSSRRNRYIGYLKLKTKQKQKQNETKTNKQKQKQNKTNKNKTKQEESELFKS